MKMDWEIGATKYFKIMTLTALKIVCRRRRRSVKKGGLKKLFFWFFAKVGVFNANC
jgi:hypothetical protein